MTRRWLICSDGPIFGSIEDWKLWRQELEATPDQDDENVLDAIQEADRRIRELACEDNQ